MWQCVKKNIRVRKAKKDQEEVQDRWGNKWERSHILRYPEDTKVEQGMV